jgi:hypothetical protein
LPFAALIVVLSLLTVPAETFGQGCAMCGAGLATDPSVAQRFNWSIVFLVATPYMLGLGVFLWIRARKTDQSAPDVSTSSNQ